MVSPPAATLLVFRGLVTINFLVYTRILGVTPIFENFHTYHTLPSERSKLQGNEKNELDINSL